MSFILKPKINTSHKKHFWIKYAETQQEIINKVSGGCQIFSAPVSSSKAHISVFVFLSCTHSASAS